MQLSVNGTVIFEQLNKTQASFAEELISYWVSFVRTGDPNVERLPRSPIWSQYTLADRKRMVLQQSRKTEEHSGSILEIESSAETRRCLVVASQASVQQN